jgi:hypothetical protein
MRGSRQASNGIFSTGQFGIEIVDACWPSHMFHEIPFHWSVTVDSFLTVGYCRFVLDSASIACSSQWSWNKGGQDIQSFGIFKALVCALFVQQTDSKQSAPKQLNFAALQVAASVSSIQ